MITVESNGQRFQFPDNMTNDQIGEAIDAHFNSQQQAQPTPQPTPTNNQPAQPAQELQELMAAPELNALSFPAAKASFGLMSTGDTESVKGILKHNFGDQVSFGDNTVTFPSGTYALNNPGLSGIDLTRAGFDMLSFFPAGKMATIPGAVAANAATEAALEAGEAAVGGDFSEGDVALAAGLGGGFKAAENLIGAGYRAVKGGITGQADEIIRAGEDAGFRVLTSDVNQPETFVGRMSQQTGEKIPFAGTGGIRETQQAGREQAVADLAERHGQYSYDTIVSSLKSQSNKVKNAAGSVLENVGRRLDEVGEIPITNTLDAIDEITEELSKPGVIQSGGAMEDLLKLSEAVQSAPQTFTTLKENRTAFRDIINGADKAERSQLPSRAKSLLNKVMSSITQDMEGFAKQNLSDVGFEKWKKANNVYASEAKKLTQTRLKNVLDKGDVTPESVKTMLFSQKPSEVKTLYDGLTASGRENARSAIVSKIIDDLSRRSSGVTPNAFASELKKYQSHVGTFFKGRQRKELEGLGKALDATRRAQDAAITTPTGQSLIGGGTVLATIHDPITAIGTGATLGGIARLYESQPVRDVLLRLGSLQKGSTRFEQALGEFQNLMNAASQTTRESTADNQAIQP